MSVIFYGAIMLILAGAMRSEPEEQTNGYEGLRTVISNMKMLYSHTVMRYLAENLVVSSRALGESIYCVKRIHRKIRKYQLLLLIV